MAVVNDDGFRSAGERGFYMRIRVTLHMLVGGKFRKHAVECVGKVACDIGIGIFVDGDAGGRVRTEDHTESFLHTGLRHKTFYRVCDVGETILLGLQGTGF